MRILPAALGVSAVIHGGAIAWALAHKIEAPMRVSAVTAIEIVVAEPTPRPVPSPVPVPAPVDVALLDRHTVVQRAPRAELAAAPMPARTELPLRVSPPAPAPAPPPSPLMHMREPDSKPPELAGPSGRFVDDFLAHGKPLAPAAIESDRLHDELASGQDHLADPRWIANHSGEEVAAERQRTLLARRDQAGHELQVKGTGYEAKHAVFTGQIEADGTAHIEKKRRYDPTEIIMNRHDIDPYASNKLRMLDDTRAERYEIGKAYKRKLLARAAVIAQTNLTYLWAHTSEPRSRKAELFAMWDECAERGSEELVAGGAAARRMIIGFIRARMTGALAYSPEELAAFNANKKSSEAFAPYTD